MSLIAENRLTPVQKYFSKLTDLVNRLLDGSPTIDDFTEFERLLKLGGVSERTIHQIYKNCHFDSWEDYMYKSKGSHNTDEKIDINCVKDKIRGALAGLRITFSKELRDC
jgi:hypothetical protein